MLAQGGEFAFVLLSLASELKVLPVELNKLLIIVVVISMALTPGLASVGKYLAEKADEADEASSGQLAALQHRYAVSCAFSLWVLAEQAADHCDGDQHGPDTGPGLCGQISSREGRRS